MLDNLLRNAQLILVVVPGNGNNNNIAANLLNTVANVNSGYSNPQQSVDAETAAVITAAVSNVIAQPFRVRKIQFIQDQGNTAWAQIGRLNVIASHDTRR